MLGTVKAFQDGNDTHSVDLRSQSNGNQDFMRNFLKSKLTAGSKIYMEKESN